MPEPGYTKRRYVWTREEIIEAIQSWASKHDGRPPVSTEWNPSDCRYSAELSTMRAAAWLDRATDFESGEYPWTGSVLKKFNSWREAIREAGFEPQRTTVLEGAYERTGTRRVPTIAALADAIREVKGTEGDARRQALYRLARAALVLAEAQDDSEEPGSHD